MALPSRPRAVPHCTACLRSYFWTGSADAITAPSVALRQQVRGKKKNAKTTTLLPVKLLKDLAGFGRKGAIVPISAGEMRNRLFPRRIADYIPAPELRTLRLSNAPIERDYSFGKEQVVGDLNTDSEIPDLLAEEPVIAQPKPKGLEKLTTERSIQLIEIFVKPVLEFYRQPIIEEKVEEPAPDPKKDRQRTASSAAADLLAARTSTPKPTGPQAIYGSVSRHDILAHVRAAIAINDEAARVILTESDIRFMDNDQEVEGKLKHTGDFTIGIQVKGAPQEVKRTVRVIPQEA